MEQVILKGQGVTYDDPESGERMLMSFPDPEGMTPDGLSHAEINPFFIHPKTGQLLDQSKFPHRWPIEGLAHSAALDIMKNAKFAGLTPESALRIAKIWLNKSVDMFNKEMRENGDAAHALPHYFDENGNINPDWARVNYGSYQPKATPTHQRQTKNADGVVTFHTNSHSVKVNGQDLGFFPESGAFPTWAFFKQLMDTYRVGSSTVLKPHVDPQEMVIGNNGEKGPVTRHLKTWAAPMGEYGMTEGERGQREMLHVDQIIAGLDPLFFYGKKEGEYSPDAASNLQSLGLTPELSSAVAQSAVGSFFNRDAPKGGTDAISTVMRHLTERIMQQTGMSAEQIQSWSQKYVRAYQATGIEERNIHHDSSTALMQALAMSEVARQANAHTPDGPSPARMALRGLSGGVEAPRLMPKEAPVRSTDLSHIRGEMEVPAYLPLQPSLVEQPSIGPGRSDGEAYGSDVRTSQDNISQLMEHLQIADARLDDSIMKEVSEVHGEAILQSKFGLSSRDITLIKSARGDWDRLAKTLMVTPRVVKVVKLSLR